MEMDCIISEKMFLYPSPRQNQNSSVDYSSCKKFIDVLVLHFKTMILALVKARKKDFFIILAGKQQKRHD